MKTIYLDYAATTPVAPEVATKMLSFLTAEGQFANPSSKHVAGLAARQAVEEARAKVAATIHAEPQEIIWTSGATESDNLAIKGIALLNQAKGKHIVTMQTEHKAVLDTCMHLEKQGFQVTYLKPAATGRLDLNTFKQALRDDTILASIMHINNETGVVQDIKSLAQAAAERNIYFHVDAAQSIGKLALDVREFPVSLISLSAHKSYGPKGVGALYLRKKPRVRLMPLLHGGGHEQGMRSGTLPTHQIVGMGEAFALAEQLRTADYEHIEKLREQFIKGLSKHANIIPNIEKHLGVPHIISMRFGNQLADALLNALPMLMASTASACQGGSIEGSHVLRAMGYPQEIIKSSIRFSIGRYTTKEDIENALAAIDSWYYGSGCQAPGDK